jgi:hypothetical protein
VELANASVEQVQQRISDLDADFQAELAQAQASVNPVTEKLETVVLRPTRTKVAVKLVGLAWLPHWKDEKGQLTDAWS